jgi:hypothetical protein
MGFINQIKDKAAVIEPSSTKDITLKEFNNFFDELMGKNLKTGFQRSNKNEIYIGTNCKTRGYTEVSTKDFSLCEDPSCCSCRWRERLYKSIKQ